jgi:hypothetical protein
MKISRNTLWLAALLSVSGCATTQHLYEGNPRPVSELAKVSVMGHQRQAGVMVKKVNGKAWDNGYFFYLPPGTHALELRVNTVPTAGAGGVAWRETSVNAVVHVVAGHTYVPEVEVLSGKASVRITDAGPDFPDACMPARIAQNRYEGVGSSGGKDGSRCDRPLPSMDNVR